MKKKFLFIAVCTMVFLTYACKKSTLTEIPESETGGLSAVVIDVTFDIRLFDTKGNNMLDPVFERSYKHEDIQHICGNTVRTIDSDVSVVKDDSQGNYHLYLFGWSNKVKVENGYKIYYGTSYLKLSSTDTDTIYTEMIIKGVNEYLYKVDYNSKTVYNSGESHSIEIIK